MLEQIDIWNDLSPKLRERLEAKIDSYGKTVRYKFDISNPNPDPDKKQGPIVWPFLYTLDPKTFMIKDDEENRAGKQKMKRIGIVKETDANGKPTRFGSIKVKGADSGILTLHLENQEDREFAMYAELHPKLNGGEFSDPSKRQVFSRIDERALSTEKRTDRKQRQIALNIATELSDKEVVEFADAMLWDSTEDLEILRSRIEELAESTPKFFADFAKSKKKEYQATIKKAVDARFIAFNPEEYSYRWADTGHMIAQLQAVGEQNEVQKLADLFLSGGTKMNETYKKIKELLK